MLRNVGGIGYFVEVLMLTCGHTMRPDKPHGEGKLQLNDLQVAWTLASAPGPADNTAEKSGWSSRAIRHAQ